MKLFQVLAILACAVTAQAQNYFSGTGIAVATNLTGVPGWAASYYVTPLQNGLPVIDYIAASVALGDTTNTSTAIRLYQSGNPLTVDAVSATGTNRITVSQTTALASNALFVVVSRRYGTAQRLRVLSSTATEIIANSTLSTNLRNGDLVYPMEMVGTLPVVTDTSVGGQDRHFVAYGNSTPIFAGDAKNRPVMVEVIGTNAPTLHIVTGRSL